MKWLLHGLAWVMLVLMILMAPILSQNLPNSSEGMAAKTYEKWSGVLRVWVHVGWQPGNGSLVPWLNENLARFEQKNPGVYVQIQSVSQETMAAFAAGDVNPPDALIFSPGALPSSDRLAELPETPQLLPDLPVAGQARGLYCATPIAMGGYAWAINTRLILAAPLGDIELPAPVKKGSPLYSMQAPRDSDDLCWSGALLSLCMAAPQADQPVSTPAPAGDGIDLGLEPSAADSSPAPPASDVELVLSLPEALPQDFRQNASALPDFLAGRAAAIPVTQAEIRRLERLSDVGRAPEYLILPGAQSFTDQLALFAIPDMQKIHAAERRALCMSLLQLLLDEEGQASLQSIRALRVTQGEALYASTQPMAALERGYRGRASYPNAFDTGFRALMARRLDAEMAGE